MKKLLIAAAVLAGVALIIKKIIPSCEGCEVETATDVIYDDSSKDDEDEDSTAEPFETVEEQASVEENATQDK